MPSLLRLHQVDAVLVKVRVSTALGGPVRDVFLLDVRPEAADGRFDEAPYLEVLERSLLANGVPTDVCAVEVRRRHQGRAASPGEADIVLDLAAGRPGAADRAVRAAVRDGFRSILNEAGGAPDRVLIRDDAVAQARARVAQSYPEVPAGQLALSDEEHRAGAGMWSLGLVLPGSARFDVLLGFVDGRPQSAHVRRSRGSEVVDSVGT
jgi:hypothetical protein